MSYSYQGLQPIRIIDPVCDVKDLRAYGVLQGGNQISNKNFTSTSISASSVQFSCPPPSGSVITSRKLFATFPIRITLTGVVTASNAGFVPPTSLINAGYDAPRNLPLSSAIDTLQVSINNDSVSINMADVIQVLSLYGNTGHKLRNSEYSSTPCYPDESQNYADLLGSNRNPLAGFGSGINDTCSQRGGFPFTVVSNATVVPTTGGTAATAIVDIVVTEPLFLSPLYFGCGNQQGFYNVNSMDFNFTFLSGAGFRMWSHNSISPVQSMGGNTVTTQITGATVQFNGFSGTPFSYPQVQPNLLFTYITPSLLYPGLGPNIPTGTPYYEVLRFPTDLGVIPYGQAVTVSSNNIQLSSIPKRCFIWARPSNQVLYNRADICDSYLAIRGIQIQWANQSTLLSASTQQQLYFMDVKNGGGKSWTEWSGQGVNNNAFPPNASAAQFGSSCGPLCLEFGPDIQLMMDECSSVNGQYQFQVNVQLQNMNSLLAWDTLPMTLYLCFIMSGVFTITSLGSATHQLGVLSKLDVIESQKNPAISYTAFEGDHGGDWWDNLTGFANKVNDWLQKTKIISSVGDVVGQVFPHQAITGATKIARDLGYGAGGRMISKHHLRKALEHR